MIWVTACSIKPISVRCSGVTVHIGLVQMNTIVNSVVSLVNHLNYKSVEDFFLFDKLHSSFTNHWNTIITTRIIIATSNTSYKHIYLVSITVRYILCTILLLEQNYQQIHVYMPVNIIHLMMFLIIPIYMYGCVTQYFDYVTT